MSGHSKWSTIKRKKAAVDAKRGKIFTRLLKEIQVAAKVGGGNVDGNPRLKVAIAAAKAQSVPNDNIDRAVKRGSGQDGDVEYEEFVYEGYGPGGVALLIKTLTDNRTRTVADVRHILGKYGGNLAGPNAVAYLFRERGVLILDKNAIAEDQLYSLALESGAEDIADEGEYWEVLCEPRELEGVRAALQAVLPGDSEIQAEIRPIPSTTVAVSGDTAHSLLKLLEVLDEHDDVQSVTANFDMSTEDLQSFSEGLRR